MLERPQSSRRDLILRAAEEEGLLERTVVVPLRDLHELAHLLLEREGARG